MFETVPAGPVHRGAAQRLKFSRGEEHWCRSSAGRGRTTCTAGPIGYDRPVVLLKKKKKKKEHSVSLTAAR